MKNESGEKSLKKPKNVLEQKRQAKSLHKKDSHGENNCIKFHSRAIKNIPCRLLEKSRHRFSSHKLGLKEVKNEKK